MTLREVFLTASDSTDQVSTEDSPSTRATTPIQQRLDILVDALRAEMLQLGSTSAQLEDVSMILASASCGTNAALVIGESRVLLRLAHLASERAWQEIVIAANASASGGDLESCLLSQIPNEYRLQIACLMEEIERLSCHLVAVLRTRFGAGLSSLYK